MSSCRKKGKKLTKNRVNNVPSKLGDSYAPIRSALAPRRTPARAVWAGPLAPTWSAIFFLFFLLFTFFFSLFSFSLFLFSLFFSFATF
jgi:hypothetical protein